MNKTFKVVFNKARGALMVVNEATSSVQKKGTKTVIAAAVATMIAGAAGTAMAETISVNNLTSGLPSFVFGEGKDVAVLSTNPGVVGTIVTVINAINGQETLQGKLAFGVLTAASQPGTHVGIGGGHFSYAAEGRLADLINTAHSSVAYQFNNAAEQTNLSFADTAVTIGDEPTSGISSEPFVIGFAGSDVVLAASSTASAENPLTLDRTAAKTDSTVTLNSGNTLAGGAGGVTVALGGNGKTLNNKSTLNIDGHANVGLASAAGVAVSMGGDAVSNVEDSVLKINTTHDANNAVSGVVVGVSAGGVALATEGTASANVGNSSTVNFTNGHGMLIAGGGIAGALGTTSADTVATAETKGSIAITVGNSDTQSLSVYGLIGGGIAASRQPNGAQTDVQTSAAAKTGKVTITLNNPVPPLTGPQKSEVISDFRYVYDAMSSPDTDIRDLALDVADKLSNVSNDGLSTNGVAVGVFGGGIAASYQSDAPNVIVAEEKENSATATATTDSSEINIKNGYNVAVVAGGAALASGSGNTKATSKVDSATVNVTGGETIGIIGGGVTYFTGTQETHSGIAAEAIVGTSNISVTGGTVDGIIGGGIAWDDSNASKTNVLSKTDTVNVTVGETGKIYNVNVNAIGFNDITDVSALPGFREVAKETFFTAQEKQIAILGGGVAAGATLEDAAGSHVGTVTIDIQKGGQVTGNIFGGGLANTGAISTVGAVNISVASGSTVNGDIYAGGIARDNAAFINERTCPGCYINSKSAVNSASVVVASGAVKGTVHTGGVALVTGTLPDTASTMSTVEKATVTLTGAGSYEGTSFVNDGVKMDGTATDAIIVLDSVNSELKASISGFQTLTVKNGTATLATLDSAVGTITGAADTVLTVKKLSPNQLTISSGKVVTPELSIASGTTLTVAGGTLSAPAAQLFVNGSSFVNTDVTKIDATKKADFVTGLTVKTGAELLLSDSKDYFYTDASLLALLEAHEGVKINVGAVQHYIKPGDSSILIDNVLKPNEDVVASKPVTTDPDTGAVSTQIDVTNTAAQTIKVEDNAAKDEDKKVITDVTLAPSTSTDSNKTIIIVGTVESKPLISNTTGAAVDNVTITDGLTLQLGTASQPTPDADVKPETKGELNKLIVKGNLQVTNIAATLDQIVADGGTINIGSGADRGSLQVNTLNMKRGSLLFIDPAWKDDAALNVIGNASHLEVVNGADSTLAGDVVVGQNAIVTYGATVAEADAAFNSANLVWGKDAVTAALYLGHQLDVTTGSVAVDGSRSGDAGLAAAAGNVELFANSLLMVDEASIGETAIEGKLVAHNPGADTDRKAQIAIFNATDGKFTLASKGVEGIAIEQIVTDNQFVDGSIKDGVVTTDVNEQKLAGAVASMGVQQMARRADTVIANTIADRTAQTIAGEGVSLWADVGGERYEADDLDNGAQYKANMFYGAFGADVGITPNARIGAAIQYGTGDSKSDNYSIKNDIDAVSLALYGTYNVTDAAKIVGEFAWTKTSNDVTSSERLLKNDIDADVISLGVRGQHEFKVGALNIVPSLGLRVSRISTDAFNVGAVKVDVDDQTLVQIPLSVAFSADIEQAGWTMKPYAKVSFTPSFGDDEINVRGYDQSALDTMPVQGDFGLSATNGNVTFGAALTAGFGQDGAQNFGGKVSVRYAF